MGRSLSPVVRRELENLDKDADSRKSALKALKLYVKDLDSKAIPVFLAQVSETKQTGGSSGEHTISLYEVLARVHGPKIVSQIENIMSTVVKTLSSSGGAFALHQACSKVVLALARYAINPTTTDEKKRYVICSLCNPLSDCLLCNQENLSSGAALCIRALVECDNWRFASTEMVNEVCQRVAGALEKHSSLNSHMGLVSSLAKNNSTIVEAYARLLIKTGLQILDAGFIAANSQKQLSAIHMVSSLMKCLDPKSILSEMELVMKEMEKCQSDRIPFVAGAANEALQIAKKIFTEKGQKLERDSSSSTDLNLNASDISERSSIFRYGYRSPFPASPESQTVDSFAGYDYLIESPNTRSHCTNGTDHNSRSVNRKLWQRFENGVDVSLKDGIFSNIARGNGIIGSEYNEFAGNNGNHLETFAGFEHGTTRNEETPRSSSPSPQRTNSCINIDDVKIFTTPRKLIRSLQDQDGDSTGFYMKQRSSRNSSNAMTPTTKYERSDSYEQSDRENRNLSCGGEPSSHVHSESVSSTDDVIMAGESQQLSADLGPETQPELHSNVTTRKRKHAFVRNIVFGIIVVLFAVMLCFLGIGCQGDRDNYNNPVPT